MVRRLAAIMFTDIVGYSALAQADEAGALRLLHEQEKLVRPLLAMHQGRKVKSIGDGLLLEFEDALDAVEFGAEFQRRLKERNAEEGVQPLLVRVGIHLGDVQRRGTDILGDAVNIASRIEPFADAGGVCISAQVFDQVRNKVPYALEKIGAKQLKGIQDPVDVYRLLLPWALKEPPEKGVAPPRLAVLPLANISPDPKDEYFADGLTEELITVLSQIRGLRVISRTSVNQYKGTTKPLAQIGSELGVDSVLEGSVRKAGDQLRIAVQLIDTKTDEHRWIQTYDRKLENVFAIQAEVAERTAGALKVELLSSEREAIEERPTANLASYESYLRGIQASHRFSEGYAEAADREAARFLEQAVREDPRFSAAYSFLANHLLGAMGMTRPSKEVVPRVRELVQAALELNPASSDAHAAAGNLAFQADLDWSRAEGEFQQAIALNPSNSAAHAWYGLLLGVLQRFGEATRQYRSAVELDPLDLGSRVNLVWNSYWSGDLEGAISSCEKLSKSFSGSPVVRGVLATLYAVAGRADGAVELTETPPGTADRVTRWRRAYVRALVGKTEEVEAFLSDWETGRHAGYVSTVALAEFYAIVGKKDRALTLLEQDYREGDKALGFSYWAQGFDSIRDEPRFVELLRKMHLPPTLARPHPSGRSRSTS